MEGHRTVGGEDEGAMDLDTHASWTIMDFSTLYP